LETKETFKIPEYLQEKQTLTDLNPTIHDNDYDEDDNDYDDNDGDNDILFSCQTTLI
jgi:hypothetical protein